MPLQIELAVPVWIELRHSETTNSPLRFRDADVEVDDVWLRDFAIMRLLQMLEWCGATMYECWYKEIKEHSERKSEFAART